MPVVQYRSVRIWKWIGLAGLVGAVAVGVTVGVRAQRSRRHYVDADPAELRERLQARLAAVDQT
jgi:hypothetical protein